MKAINVTKGFVISSWLGVIGLLVASAAAQLIDQTKTTNAAGEGIAKSLAQQIGIQPSVCDSLVVGGILWLFNGLCVSGLSAFLL